MHETLAYRRPAHAATLLAAGLAAILAACGGGSDAGGGGGPPATTAAPFGLSSIVNGGAIQLSWVNAAADATTVEVDRAPAAGGPFTNVAILPPTETSYQDADPALAPGATYWHRVRAQGPNGPSAWTATVQTTLPQPPPPPTGPSAPTGLTATPSGSAAISLSWTNTAADATAIEVHRAASALGPFALVATLAASAASHADGGLTPATTYWYFVAATNANGSGQSSVVSATTGLAPPAPPPAPTGLAAVATSPTSVSLTWTSGGGTLSGYEVQRATASGGTFSLVATPPSTATGYGDSGLTTGTTYWYRVRAVNAGGASTWTAEASATPVAVPPSAPAAPSGLAVAPASTNSLSLSWTDNASDETGFEVERAAAPAGPFGKVFTAAPNATSWTDTGLATTTTYWYRVRAVNGVGPSAFTTVASATTAAPPAPAPPTGLAAVVDQAGSAQLVRLAWSDAATNETGYELQHSIDGVAWDPTVALQANTASYVDGTPAIASTNFYRVRAVNGGGGSAWVQISVYVPFAPTGSVCDPPLGISAAPLTGTAIRLVFTNTSLPCRLTAIERSPSASGPWAEVARLSSSISGATTWDDAALIPGATYHYRLRAIGTNVLWISSAYSPPVQATTTAPPALPAPTGLTATVTSSTTATLRWTDTASGETGFAVEYATAAAGPFTEAFRLPANTTQTDVGQMNPATAYWFRVRTVQGTVLSAPSNAASLTTAFSSGPLRTTGDATVVESTATSANQNVNFPAGRNSVGCYFTWTVDTIGQIYLFHNCAGSALRFDTSALAGRTILSAALVMFPCGLAPGPVADATYVVRALSSAWSPSAVTFNTLPSRYVAGGWSLQAPTAGGAQAWDVTTMVRNWANGTWANHGLFVEQSPIADRQPAWGGETYDWQDQTTGYCSLEQTGGSIDWVPTLWVDYQ